MYDDAKNKTIYFAWLLRLVIISFCFCYPQQPVSCLGAQTFTLKQPRTRVTFTGFTRPIRTMTITSEVAGRCLSVADDIGEFTDKSRPFIRIDPTFILLDINANKLAQQKITRQISLNKLELDRYSRLHTNKSIPQTKLDQIRLQHDISNIELKSLQNTEKILREQHQRHQIIAPHGYQVIARYIEPGELVNKGQPLADIGDFRELIVPLALNHDEFQALSATSPITVLLPDLNQTLKAELFRVTPGFDPKSRKIKTELIISRQQLNLISVLRGGERVLVQLSIPNHLASYIVPASAVQERHGYYWLTKEDGTSKNVAFFGKATMAGHLLVSGKTLKPDEIFLSQPDQNIK